MKPQLYAAHGSVLPNMVSRLGLVEAESEKLKFGEVH